MWSTGEATCKLFIACLNYSANIDWRLGYPVSYLLLPQAHPWCGRDEFVWSGSGWTKQGPDVLLRDMVPWFSQVALGCSSRQVDVQEEALALGLG